MPKENQIGFPRPARKDHTIKQNGIYNITIKEYDRSRFEGDVIINVKVKIGESDGLRFRIYAELCDFLYKCYSSVFFDYISKFHFLITIKGIINDQKTLLSRKICSISLNKEIELDPICSLFENYQLKAVFLPYIPIYGFSSSNKITAVLSMIIPVLPPIRYQSIHLPLLSYLREFQYKWNNDEQLKCPIYDQISFSWTIEQIFLHISKMYSHEMGFELEIINLLKEDYENCGDNTTEIRLQGVSKTNSLNFFQRVADDSKPLKAFVFKDQYDGSLVENIYNGKYVYRLVSAIHQNDFGDILLHCVYPSGRYCEITNSSFRIVEDSYISGMLYKTKCALYVVYDIFAEYCCFSPVTSFVGIDQKYYIDVNTGDQNIINPDELEGYYWFHQSNAYPYPTYPVRTISGGRYLRFPKEETKNPILIWNENEGEHKKKPVLEELDTYLLSTKEENNEVSAFLLPTEYIVRKGGKLYKRAKAFI